MNIVNMKYNMNNNIPESFNASLTYQGKIELLGRQLRSSRPVVWSPYWYAIHLTVYAIHLSKPCYFRDKILNNYRIFW